MCLQFYDFFRLIATRLDNLNSWGYSSTIG